MDLIDRQTAIDRINGTGYADQIKSNLILILRMLPSAQPDLDEWCTDCKEYDHDKHCCPRWNRVIRTTLEDVQHEKRTEERTETHACDLVSRQAAIDEFKCCELTPDGGIDANYAIEFLEQLPSAQPERKTGRWLKISPAGIYECSECGKNVMTKDIDAYDFCHGCGAKMEVEHEV